MKKRCSKGGHQLLRPPPAFGEFLPDTDGFLYYRYSVSSCHQSNYETGAQSNHQSQGGLSSSFRVYSPLTCIRASFVCRMITWRRIALHSFDISQKVYASPHSLPLFQPRGSRPRRIRKEGRPPVFNEHRPILKPLDFSNRSIDNSEAAHHTTLHSTAKHPFRHYTFVRAITASSVAQG
jgi:hypothetical protein